MTAHRPSPFGRRTPRDTRDPETSSDARVRAVVDGLSQLDYAPAPSPQFRAELRTQLVAIAPRIVAEGAENQAPATAATAAPTTSTSASTAPATRRRRIFGRPLGLATAVLAVLALLLGGAVWKSQSALPGDSLYGLKRTSEDVRLAVTSGDTDRGHEYLALATTRVQEAQDLLGRPSALAAGGGVLAGGLSTQAEALITDTLRSANSDLTSGSLLLRRQAITSRSTAALDIVTSWAPTQLDRLEAFRSAAPTSALRARATTSWKLVNNALTRATSLKPRIRQGCTPGSDRFGPTCTRAAKHTPTHTPKQPAPGRTHAKRTHPSGTTGTGASRHTSSGSGRSHPTTGSAGPPSASPTGVPVLPVTIVPSIPVSVGSCGVHATIAGIGLNAGSCPPGS